MLFVFLLGGCSKLNSVILSRDPTGKLNSRLSFRTAAVWFTVGRPPNGLWLLSIPGNMQNKFDNFVLVEEVLGRVISEPYRVYTYETPGSEAHRRSVHLLVCTPVAMLVRHCVMVQGGLMEGNAQRFCIASMAVLENLTDFVLNISVR